MKKFTNYILFTSLTLLFILAGGIIDNESGMLLAILISSAAYIYAHFYRKEQIYAPQEKNIDTESIDKHNDDAAIYAVVERLVKRTDMDISTHYKNDGKTYKELKYGTI